ncbi:serine aminopeptidase domain-containing protein [Streptomyces sp. NPDC051218]|uniref:serine aminopeptidase domain-containing protein n=1 Tax=Streptomyces sp. NPDC051218 TaxID=3365645 RepID=UPI0037BB3354
MTTPRRFTFTGRDGTQIVAFRWEPAGTPRAIVQITHGVGEYVRRYSHVAASLVAAGYAVQGQDHRGHGATAGSEEALGQIGAAGWTELVHDIGELAALGRQQWPGVPLFLLSHSLGSFATQQFLLHSSDRVDGVVLTGTSALDLLEPALDLDAEIDLSAFNAGIEPARNGFDWISRDDGIVDAYLGDPYCGFGLDPEGMKAMVAGARAVAAPERMAQVRADLPLAVMVGGADPVGGHGELVKALVDRYRTAGLTDVSLRVYEGARHEILNETNRAEVINDILGWLNSHTPTAD